MKVIVKMIQKANKIFIDGGDTYEAEETNSLSIDLEMPSVAGFLKIVDHELDGWFVLVNPTKISAIEVESSEDEYDSEEEGSNESGATIEDEPVPVDSDGQVKPKKWGIFG